MNYEIVSEEMRAYHRDTVRKLQVWRTRYAALSTAIRSVRRALAAAHAGGQLTAARGHHAALDILRNEANWMMEVRDEISDALRINSYRYAPREALA
jgi:hypothetical protein